MNKVLLTLVLFLTAATTATSAGQNDDNQAGAKPYSVVLTHYGGEYKVRFTIEGASGIQGDVPHGSRHRMM